MVTLSAFLQGIRENIARITHYENAGDGTGGGCDCIGLIIGGLELCGFDWPGTHGSNWARRNAMATFGPISSASECFLGEIVYKAREPGESGYNLPSAYKNSPDQRDYYHVGVVTSANPLCITHCTGVDGGIKRDNTLGKWRWGGKLKYVNYDEGSDANMTEEPLYRAVVTAENDYPVRMRANPSQSSRILAQVPQGTEVEVNDVLDGWSAITYNGKAGYMMTNFLIPVGGDDNEDTPPAEDDETRNELETVKISLETALNIIDKLLARG